jgi:dTDP-4-amino-4,6-dideoxygalactose transaminase
VENSLIHIPKSERDCVWHIFPVFCEQRDALQQFLRNNGVETQIHYPIPPHKQRCYAKWNDLSLPVTERLSAQELSLPCNEAMTNQEVLSVVEVLNAFTV